MLGRLVSEEEGQSNAEYGFFLFLIAVASITILVVLGTKVRDLYADKNQQVTSTQ